MKSDIEFPKVEGISVAVIIDEEEHAEPEWKVYLINENKFDIENALIASRGYGEKDGEKQETSILRHMIEHIGSNQAALIEPIKPDLFHLTNQYWVSYYVEGKVFDKKFIFLPETLKKNNFVDIPILNQKGVLHR